MEKGYYRCVYVMVQFKKEVDVASKEEKSDAEDDTNEDEMDDFVLDDKRERDKMMVLKEIMESWMIIKHCYILRGRMYI